MRTMIIRLIDGNEGEVSLDIARSMISNGHAVAVASPVAPVFDPSESTVDEVLAHLAGTADEGEVARIQQAERDGKNRKTLTDVWDGQGSDEDSETA